MFRSNATSVLEPEIKYHTFRFRNKVQELILQFVIMDSGNSMKVQGKHFDKELTCGDRFDHIRTKVRQANIHYVSLQNYV